MHAAASAILPGFPGGTSPADLEAELEENIAEFVDDPLGYVLFAFEWGEGDLKGQDGPDVWQADLLRQVGDRCLTVAEALRVAVAAGHGVGKSAIVAWLIMWFMSTRPNAAGVVTANTRSQLVGKTWRELSLWHKRAINAHWFEWSATKFAHVAAPDVWCINAVPWSKNRPEAFAGLHAEHVLMIFDEASAIEDIIYETAEGALTTPGAMWFLFGNPTRNSGRFREAFGRFRHRWLTRQIDSRSAKMANPAQIKQWLEDYGESSDFFKVRVRGEFPTQSSTQFISSTLVEAAMLLDMSEVDEANLVPRVMGVDVARFGDDKSVIIIRDGNVVRHDLIRSFVGQDTVEIAAQAAGMINEYQPDAIFIDGAGVGGGVVDILKNQLFKVIEVNGAESPRDKMKYANLRCEMWGNMRDWLGTGRVSLPDNRELRDDLIGLEYGYNLKGAIQLEKKEDMKARGLSSPDFADALSLTFARPVANRAVREKLNGGHGRLPKHANGGPNEFKQRYRRSRR